MSRSHRTVEDDDFGHRVACLDVEEDKDWVHGDPLRHHMGHSAQQREVVGGYSLDCDH